MSDSSENKGDIDLFSLGMVYRFSSKSSDTVATAPKETAAPEKSAPAKTVVATPLAVVVPLAKNSQRYCSILDIQFEIDNDSIERQQKEKLAVVGTFMNKYPDTTAVIEGHSDNVGSKDHTTALLAESSMMTSTRRFFWRPAAEALLVTGKALPFPVAEIVSAATPRLTR